MQTEIFHSQLVIPAAGRPANASGKRTRATTIRYNPNFRPYRFTGPVDSRTTNAVSQV